MTVLVGTTQGLHEVGRGNILEADRPIVGISKLESTAWLLFGDRALYRSVDDSPWKLVAPIRQWPGSCLAATSLAPLIGTAGAHLLFLGSGVEAFDSFERAPGRAQWYTPWGGPPATRSITEGLDGTLYVNVHVGGILRSKDRGRSWEPTIDIDTDVHQVLAHPQLEPVVLAATGTGFAISDDGGTAWRFENVGLHATYCRAVAVAGDTILVSASRSHRGEQAALYRKPLRSDAPFERCREGLPEWFGGNVDSHWLAATQGIVAAGTPEGAVYVSRDAGEVWTKVAEDLPTITCLGLG
ncbi:MAG TPA: hypothetical protein VF972_01495 [Actinomycetota bacterium]